MEFRRKAAAACIAAATFAAAVSGCGDDEGAGGERASGDQKPKPVRVAVVMASLDNDFYVAQKEGIDAEAADQEGADAIAVNGSDTKPLLPVLERVIAEDIPLVLFDAPADELKGKYAAYIGTDNRAGGEAGGRWLAEAMPEGGELGVLLCVAGHPVTTARLEGFKSGLGDAPFKIVATADADCDRAKGRKAMEDMISAHSDLDAVFSTSDSHSLGAVAALEAAGKDPKFVSFDAQPEAVEAIQAGKVLDASVAWSAHTIGSEAVKAAVAAARGEQVEPETMVPVTVVDADNAADWSG